MDFCKRIYTFIIVFVFCVSTANAQNRPIGYWRSHLPYNTALGVAGAGSSVYFITDQGFCTFDPAKDGAVPRAYSKTDGMSDVGMQSIGYDNATSTAILVYSNGNIDLFKDNSFYNIPDLKLKSVAGSKEVHSIYTENGTAYLSTSLGILVIDLAKYDISETYQFILNNQAIPVTSFTGCGEYFYAITSNGLYRALKNNPELQNFQVWTRLDSTHSFTSLTASGSTLYLSDATHVYNILNDTVHKVYTSLITVNHVDGGTNRVFISEYNPNIFHGDIKLLLPDNTVTDSFYCGNPAQVIELADGTIWAADGFAGIAREEPGKLPAYFVASGPNNANSFDIYVHNKDMWVAHGGFSEKYTPNGWGSGFGISHYANDQWKKYEQYGYAPFSDSVVDLVSVVKDETDGTVYMGSYVCGLFVLKQDGSYEIFKQNSVLDSSRSVFYNHQRQVIGLALDKSRNLWITEAFAQHQLYAKTPDNVWYKFLVPDAPNGGPITIDDNGQVWFACIAGGGVAVYNTNGDLTKPAGHTSYHLTTGVGFGNLPSNNVFCLAADKNNNIWIGTDNGIGIVSNCTGPFTQSQPCDAEIPIVQYDQFAGYLFAGNNVRSIAVDGANRKWVGTDNGAWLLSPDASKIVYRFTAENSPLPSNNIQKISLDDVTGDVYIGTDRGMVSYHSTATEGETVNKDVLVFPDPVPSGYTGTIAIKGLAANADVRITDIDGQLVYRTKALGGQAVWSGVDYKGHRPQTGVYLIFVSSSDGSQTYAGKIMFMN